MTLYIVSLFLIGLLLIASEQTTHINKAAVAMFVGVTCWILYITMGTDFVLSEHGADFREFLGQTAVNGSAAKDFIAQRLFSSYTMYAANVVLFLLATTTIVEVLDNNGCFDFAHEILRTRRPRQFMWIVAGLTFVISANLDNLTTTCLMLAVMHRMVADERMRWTMGAVIVVAANMGGAFTAIGDTTSLALWSQGLVTPSAYSARLVLPSLAALVTVLVLVHLKLPHSMHLVRTAPPYRGDDTILNQWQRALMLAVGIGGLWFIPTFHRITHLPAFLGALCVLSVLWIVNELCNHRLLQSDVMVKKRNPLALQYQNVQNMLFFLGMVLAVGAVNEAGFLPDFSHWMAKNADNYYVIGALGGLLSALVNNVSIMLMNIAAFTNVTDCADYAAGGNFWPWLSYCTSIGGSLLAIGTMAGFAYLKMENVSFGWYVRHFLPKVLAGFIVGGVVFYLTTLLWA